jgi:hypothetical protein
MSETNDIAGFPADEFGEVVRIGWCTFYFGADSHWHNARTGALESRNELLRLAAEVEGDWHRLIPEVRSVSEEQ